MTKPRLAIVISHVIQHFAPVYKKIAESGDIDLKVFFVAENGASSYQDQDFGTSLKWDVTLTSGYPHEFVEPGNIIEKFGFFSVDSKKLVSAVERFSPDFIWLNGYATRANWRILFGPASNVKYIYGSDSNPVDSRSRLVRLIKSPIVKYFLKRSHYFLSISPANREYLQSYGVSASAITDSKYPVDIERLKLQRDVLDFKQIEKLRAKFQIPLGAKVILFAGKLIAHKRPQDALLALLEPELQDLHSIIVGSGERLRSLEKQAKSLNIQNRVHFAGFVNQSELAKYFELADILLFPSAKEPYGAIAAETLPFGLPIVATDVIGAIGESIMPDVNALLYPVADIAHLGHQLRRLIKDDELRKKFSANSVELADEHDKSVMARDIIDICLQR